MTFTNLGKVPVPTPGTPVPLTTNKALTACRIVVSQVPGTTGLVHLKNIRASAAGVIARSFLVPGASGFADEHVLDCGNGSNQMYPWEWGIDAANATEGLNVYWATA
jgi:hypothetical protein